MGNYGLKYNQIGQSVEVGGFETYKCKMTDYINFETVENEEKLFEKNFNSEEGEYYISLKERVRDSNGIDFGSFCRQAKYKTKYRVCVAIYKKNSDSNELYFVTDGDEIDEMIERYVTVSSLMEKILLIKIEETLEEKLEIKEDQKVETENHEKENKDLEILLNEKLEIEEDEEGNKDLDIELKEKLEIKEDQKVETENHEKENKDLEILLNEKLEIEEDEKERKFNQLSSTDFDNDKTTSSLIKNFNQHGSSKRIWILISLGLGNFAFLGSMFMLDQVVQTIISCVFSIGKLIWNYFKYGEQLGPDEINKFLFHEIAPNLVTGIVVGFVFGFIQLIFAIAIPGPVGLDVGFSFGLLGSILYPNVNMFVKFLFRKWDRGANWNNINSFVDEYQKSKKEKFMKNLKEPALVITDYCNVDFKICVQMEMIRQFKKSYILLSRSETDDHEYVECKRADTSFQKFSFSCPNKPGIYEFRYFAQWPVPIGQIVKSKTFEVKEKIDFKKTQIKAPINDF
jgi:hypothetical protein